MMAQKRFIITIGGVAAVVGPALIVYWKNQHYFRVSFKIFTPLLTTLLEAF
jgi:hypothetical protein